MTTQPTTCPACATDAQDYYVRCPGCQERRRKHIEKWHKQPDVDNLPGPSTPGLVPAPLRPFDIGHVPAGWTRGALLHVSHAPGFRSYICEVVPANFAPLKAIPKDLVGGLTFTDTDLARVGEWLEWWYARP